MNHEDQEIELFDDYLDGRMSAPEREAFENALRDDSELAARLDVHRILRTGMRDFAKNELKDHLRRHGKMMYWGENFWPRNMRFAAAAAILIFGGLYVVVQFYLKPAAEAKMIAAEQTAPEPKIIRGPQDSAILDFGEAAVTQTDTLTFAAVPESKFSMVTEVPSIEVVEDEQEMKDLAEAEYRMDAKPELYVESERMLSDTFLLAIVLSEEYKALSKVQSADANVTYRNNLPKKKQLPAETSNVAQAEVMKSEMYKDTVVKETKTVTTGAVNSQNYKLKVEYWTSPLRFKGYTYAWNTIRLYSVKEGSGQLFYYGSRLYLLLDNQVYLLMECQSGCPFKSETDQDIVNHIRNQVK